MRDRTSHRQPAALAALVALLALSVASVIAAPGESPVSAWQQRLDQAASTLGRVPAGDPGAVSRLAVEVDALRNEVARWLAAFPPALEGTEPWLPPAVPLATVEEVAGEISRLRAVLSRVASALQGGDPGAFYLGRVEVTVTAAAATTPAGAAPVASTVIDSEAIAANDRSSLSGALALAPGVSLVRIGSRNETAVYVRGYDQRQVPLFIDGIPVYTPYDGYADFDRFTTFDVAEIRVSKGFASVLYGPNVLGGAINVVSRRPASRLEGRAGLVRGSGSSRTAYANVGSRLGRWYLQGTASYLEADTFPLPGGFEPVTNQPAGDRLNAAREDGKFSVKLGWTPTAGSEHAISYVMQRGEKGNPPYAGTDPGVRVRYWKWPYYDKDSVYLVSQSQLGALGYVKARAFYDRYANALYSFDDATYTTQKRSSSFRSLYEDHAAGASAEWGNTLGRHTIRAAAHVKRDDHQDHNSGEPPKDFAGRIISLGIEDTVVLTPRLSLVTGLGADWQTTTKAQDYQRGQQIDLKASCSGDACGNAGGINPQIGLFQALPSGLARLTLSRKTRLPTLNNRYSYRMGTAIPNPGLDPEHSLLAEAGYDGALGPGTTFQAAVFYGRITDLIQSVVIAPNLSQLQNIGRVSQAGLEADLRTRLPHGVLLSATYTFLDRNNLSDPDVRLVETPRHKATVSAAVPVLPQVSLSAFVQFEADRLAQNSAGRYMDAPSFAEVSLKGVWTIGGRLDVEASVHNLFDADYWIADGYPEPGRTLLVGARVRF
jgi:iron complex outermembrane receptor protein